MAHQTSQNCIRQFRDQFTVCATPYFLYNCHRLTIFDKINAFIIWLLPAASTNHKIFTQASESIHFYGTLYYFSNRPTIVGCISQLELISYGRQPHFHPAGAPCSDERDSGLIQLPWTWRKLGNVFLLNGPKGTTNGTPGSHKIRYREIFRPVPNPKLSQSFRLKRIQRTLKPCKLLILTGWNGQLYSQKRTYWWLHNALGSTIFWWKVNLSIFRSQNHLYIHQRSW